MVLKDGSRFENVPLLKIAQTYTIEAISADGSHTAEDDNATWATEWKITFVLDLREPSGGGHIPGEPHQKGYIFLNMSCVRTIGLRLRTVYMAQPLP